MQKIMQSKLFRLLSETSQNEDHTSQLEEAYDEFSLKILTKLQLETNHEELYFSLGFIHSKLAGLCERLLVGEQGKKCPEDRNQSHVYGWIGHAGTGMANYCVRQ
jgi:hypothetical protein